MGTGTVVTLVIIALLVLLAWSWSRRNSSASSPTSTPTPPRRPLTMEEVSQVLQDALRSVEAAIETCKAANGPALPAARDHLHQTVADRVARIQSLVRDEPTGSRLRHMTALTSAEIIDNAAPSLSLKAALRRGVPLSREEMSNTQRFMWMRAEVLIAAHVDSGRSRETRAQLERLPEQLRIEQKLVAGRHLSERQRLMWELAVEEIDEFVGDALKQPG